LGEGLTVKKHFAMLKVEKSTENSPMPELAVVPRPDNVGFPDVVLAEVSAALSEQSSNEAPSLPEPAPASSTSASSTSSKPRAGGWADRMKGSRAVGSVATALGDLRDHNNAEIAELKRQLAEGQPIVELDTDKIDSSFVADRMDSSDEATEELKSLIEDQGQLVPILVRPHPEHADRYQVAFGHRRLKAVRLLGRRVRAVIRKMTDEELIIAQGQENNARLDLTYIEKARFASTLLRMNFSRKAVEQALTVNHSQVVWFKQVTDAVPDEILVAIGRAPKIGRPRWLQFAEVIAKPGNVKKARAIILTESFLAQSPDDRFSHLAKELTEKKSEPPLQAVWADPKGRKLASFTYTDTKCTVQIDRRDDPDFAEYLYSKLGDVYRDYEAQKLASE
jgi:ParB family transcriptional regulator, chromosome partitioning protein